MDAAAGIQTLEAVDLDSTVGLLRASLVPAMWLYAQFEAGRTAYSTVRPPQALLMLLPHWNTPHCSSLLVRLLP